MSAAGVWEQSTYITLVTWRLTVGDQIVGSVTGGRGGRCWQAWKGPIGIGEYTTAAAARARLEEACYVEAVDPERSTPVVLPAPPTDPATNPRHVNRIRLAVEVDWLQPNGLAAQQPAVRRTVLLERAAFDLLSPRQHAEAFALVVAEAIAKFDEGLP